MNRLDNSQPRHRAAVLPASTLSRADSETLRRERAAAAAEARALRAQPAVALLAHAVPPGASAARVASPRAPLASVARAAACPWPQALRCAADGEPIGAGHAALDPAGRLVDFFRLANREAKSTAHLGQLAAQYTTCTQINDLLTWWEENPDAARPEVQAAAARILACPISHELPQDPVNPADGYSYERADLAQWLASNRTSPVTRQPLDTQLPANAPMRALIEELALLDPALSVRPSAPPLPLASSSALPVPSAPPAPPVPPALPAQLPAARLPPPARPLATPPAPLERPRGLENCLAEFVMALASDRQAPGRQAHCALRRRPFHEGAFAHPDPVRSIVAGGLGVITGDAVGKLRIWTFNGFPRECVEAHHKPVEHLALTPDGQTLASAGEGEGEIKQWQIHAAPAKLTLVKTTRVERLFWGPAPKVTALVANNQTVAFGASNGEIVTVGRGRDGVSQATMGYLRGGVSALAFWQDELLSSGGGREPSPVKSWKLSSLVKAGEMHGPGGRVGCLATNAPGAHPVMSILCGDESGGILVDTYQGAANQYAPLMVKLAVKQGGVRQLCWASPHAYCVSDGGLDLIVPSRDRHGVPTYELVPVGGLVRRVAVHCDDAYALDVHGKITGMEVVMV